MPHPGGSNCRNYAKNSLFYPHFDYFKTTVNYNRRFELTMYFTHS